MMNGGSSGPSPGLPQGAILGAAVAYGVYYGPIIAIRWTGTAPGVVKTWQEAEKFISRTLNIAKNTATVVMNGRDRIPDFIDHGRRFIGDSNCLNNLTSTQQLRDYADFARQNGYRLCVFVRDDTVVTQPVLQLIQSTGGSVNRFLIKP